MKKLWSISNLLLAVTLFLIMIGGASAITYSFNNSVNGAFNFTANYTGLYVVEVWGGGGGGAGLTGSGGGGGGGYARSIINLTNNYTYNYSIGTGGAGSTSGTGVAGESTWFNHTSTLSATGGRAGVHGSGGGGGGAGGAGVNGTDLYTGGTGGAGGGTTNHGSGGGGAGDGTTLNGNATNGKTGTSATRANSGTTLPVDTPGGDLSGGNGGDSGYGAVANGTAGQAFGGGGGGGLDGASGGKGALRITYGDITTTKLYIYNESSLSLATGTNLIITINNENNTYIYSTLTGQIISYVITPGVYTILITGSPYQPRQYIMTISNTTETTLNAYMTTSSSTTLFTIKDSSNSMGIENAIVTMSKSLSGSYTTIESKFSDVTGSAQFSYVPYTMYRFAISKSGYSSIVFYLNPVLLSGYTILLVPSSTASLNYDNIGVVLTPTSFYNDRQNNLTFTISSPDGVLSSYGINASYPSGWVDDAGVNANGGILYIPFNTSATTSAFDTVNITYFFTSVNTGYHEYNLTYSIRGGVAMGTFLRNQAERFGLGDFEAVLIATIFILLVAGAATYFGGSLIGGVIGLFMMGYFFYIGLLPLWSIILSMLAGFVFISWRSTA